MTLEEYKKAVVEELQTSNGLFKDKTPESIAYLESEQVAKNIEEDYKKGKNVKSCAWIIDMCF